MLQEDGVSIAPSSSFLSLSLSPSLTHASAVWLMAGDQSKSAWETEYFSGKIIPLDLLCNTKAVLCFTLTLHWGRGACCASGSSFLCAWIKNMSEYAFGLLPPPTHTQICAHTHFISNSPTSTPSTYHYMHALNFALTSDWQWTVRNFKLIFSLI